jgi:hypothetical protein
MPIQLPVQWVLGTLFPKMKQQGLEAYYSPPTNAEVKKAWVYTSTSQYTFIV